MAYIGGIVRGGWFPEQWDIPVAIGLGVVITGYVGDTIAGFISQYVPAAWLNPVSELIVGLLLFIVGGMVGGDISMWIRLFSFGAFSVGIADSITVLLGLTASAAAVRVITAPSQVAYTSQPGVRTVPATRTNAVGTYRVG